MRFTESTTLKEQIKLLTTELESTRSDLRVLQRQHRRSALSTRLFYLSGLIAFVFLLGIAHSPPSAAQKLVSHFEAPFIVEDSSHKPIVEISDEPGRWGLTVYGKHVGKVALGSNEDGGFIGVLGSTGLITKEAPAPKPTMLATIDVDGFKYFGKVSNTALASVTSFEGKGVVVAYNQAGKAIAFLTEKDNHGGSVTVADPAGDGVFSAGFTGDGGNACVSNRKRGLQCLGIGLPLQIK